MPPTSTRQLQQLRLVLRPLVVVVFCGLVLGVRSESDTTAAFEHHNNETEEPTEEEIGCPVESMTEERFQVAHFDFEYVSTPLIVSLWVLFVSVAKVGKWQNVQTIDQTGRRRCCNRRDVCSGNESRLIKSEERISSQR